MIIFNIIFAIIGYEEYAAVTICKAFENLMFVFFAGLGNASAIMVGKSVGSGNFEEAKLNAKRFTVVVPILGAAALIVLVVIKLVSFCNVCCGKAVEPHLIRGIGFLK